jgi:uncharacterized membrane protein YedE/YeeE
VIPHPLPWYVAGPLIGLVVPALLLAGNKAFGISSSFRHVCAAVAPGRIEYFRHDWRLVGAWNLVFLTGVFVGAAVAWWLAPAPAVAIAPDTVAALAALGVGPSTSLAPPELFSWASLLTARGLIAVVGGGFLVGFGTAYAGGCTSGHAISGLADFQVASLVAVAGFFAGGLVGTHVVLPVLLG